MTETVVVEARFNGPPDSGNGGYVCGLAAAGLAPDSADDGGGVGVLVTLRLPPPIDRPLRRAPTETGVGLFDGEALVAEARPADVVTTLPPAVAAVDLDAAVAATTHFDVDDYRAHHPYPTCFGCGPDRAPGDGMRIFPGDTGPDTVAWPWRPDPSFADDDGRVDPVFLWAALDCLGGYVWLRDPATDPMVLGRMAAVVHRRPALDEQLYTVAWQAGADGRRRMSGSALRAADGSTVAVANATWVVLTEEQQAAFRAAGR